MTRTLGRGAVLCLLVACNGTDGVKPTGILELALEEVATGLDYPVLVTSPPTDPNRLFVVEKSGTIRIIKNGQLLPAPFLDIGSQVTQGSEQGLLSMAFHHGYATNGVFVVSYTNVNGDSRVSTFRVSVDPDIADASSEIIIIGAEQPYSNHNGGHVAFGPFGYLFIGFGDGGSSGDPQGLAQDLQTFHGKILRMLVRDDGTATVPAGNPLVGQPGSRWEVWSRGLRNPWRFSFDRLGGALYIGDVGQDRMEEISIRTAGQGSGRGSNFGWNTMEGTLCFQPATDCTPASGGGLVLPALVYTHSDGCSVTGGHVYRGLEIPELDGWYFFGDYCGGWVRSFRYLSGMVANLVEWSSLAVPEITSFGEDARGELYVVSATGTVNRVIRK
jgi:glucose/arabinose dehydrogenase